MIDTNFTQIKTVGIFVARPNDWQVNVIFKKLFISDYFQCFLHKKQNAFIVFRKWINYICIFFPMSHDHGREK